MDIEAAYHYLKDKPGAEETFPFGEDVLVFKVMGKMFALVNLSAAPHRLNLKCDPERAVQLREAYEGVEPGWHMNKRHWNTVHLQSTVPNAVLREMMDESYALVVQGLKQADRAKLRHLSAGEDA